MTRRPALLARQALLDATVVATLVADALHALEAGAGGYPTSTPGASPAEAQGSRECPRRDCNESLPCPEHDRDLDATSYGPVATEWGHQPADKTTMTERLATAHDTAIRDLEALNEAIRKSAHHARQAAAIVSRWAHGGLNESDIKARLVAIDSEIWCAHCSTYGRHEPRKRGKEHCDFCDGFKERKFKRTNGDVPAIITGVWTTPPKEIWDARDARNGRLDETTITRILKACDVQRRADNIAKKAAEKAEREAAKMAEAG